MAYAQASDVQVRLGRELDTETQALVETRLEDVERRILSRIPTLAEKVLDGTVDPEDIITVEADAVVRLVRNPDGYVQETDGSYSYMISTELANAAGRISILPEEWELLGYRRNRIFVIAPTLERPR
ncbi:hypothetical protein N806_31205 [Rhodococcus sp. P27]|nr:hypothetical protein N806_31205 [Rhodococcus sp. P27]